MVANDCVTQDTVVALQRPLHLLRMLFPQPGAALDVCEKEGRDGGLVVHGRQYGGGTPQEIQRLHCVSYTSFHLPIATWMSISASTLKYPRK
jgi:hypothetical protein